MEICGLLMIFALFFVIGRVGFLRIVLGALIIILALVVLGAVLS